MVRPVAAALRPLWEVAHWLVDGWPEMSPWSGCLGLESSARHLDAWPWLKFPAPWSHLVLPRSWALLCLNLGLEGLVHITVTNTHTHTHTHTHLTAPFPGLPGWAGARKLKPIWILLKQETVSGSGISWAICKSAPRSIQTTMPAPHRSVFTGQMPFLPPNQQRQSTAGILLLHTLSFSVCRCLLFKKSLMYQCGVCVFRYQCSYGSECWVGLFRLH